MEVEKTEIEKIIFLKYKKWLHYDGLIPDAIVEEYKNDLKNYLKWKNQNIIHKITM